MKLNLISEAKKAIQSITIKTSTHLLIQTIACRLLGHHEEAALSYEKLQATIRHNTKKQLTVPVTSILLLPLNSDKRLVEQYISQFLSLLKLHNPNAYSAQTKNFNQLESKPEFASLFLKSLPFLHRVEKVINPEIKKFKQGQLLDSTQVYLVLNGTVLLRQLTLDAPTSTAVLSVCKPGTFIHKPDLDLGVSSKLTTFAEVGSTVCHLLRVTCDLWSMAAQPKPLLLQVVAGLRIFEPLSLQTKHKIVYEYG